MKTPPGPRWLLLIHQIPPKPDYLRVKIGRRLYRTGAVAIKNSVYALPFGSQHLEDLNWISREIIDAGGEASIVEARLLEGLGDVQLQELFRSARDADYAPLLEEVAALASRVPRRGVLKEGLRTELEGSLERLRKRQAEIATRDFFQATGQLRLGKAIAALEASLSPSPKVSPGTLAPGDYLGRTWVTRSGIHVDRMACAWLIRRFIDPKAKLKFVAAKGHHPAAGELHFDMFEGEFTHQGDLCSFEVFLQRFGLEDSGLRWLAEIVHDIDVKDGKFGRDEVAGVAQMVVAIASAHPTDDARLQRASALFDDLYQLFKRARV